MSSSPYPLDRAVASAAHHFDRPAARVFAAFAFACLLSIGIFPDAWLSMVRVWSNSETFAHGFIALPCAAWMLWRRSDDWSPLPQRIWWPAAIALAGCGVLWLVGRLGGVASIEQFAAVAFIAATMLLLVGPTVTRALAFPLAFLFFAVPVGEFLTPLMMDYTADATVTALRWSGIPVFREGLHFSLPTGRWSVVEACSGLRYLIASLALGVLYAYLQFRTLRYRLAFVALALVVPIVANWVRAYGIVLLGHLSDMRIATGVDHLIYGWLFFGFVMALLFWIGSRWREPPSSTAGREDEARAEAPNDTPSEATFSFAHAASALPPRSRMLAAAALALAVAFVWRPVAAGLLDATQPVDAIAPLRTALAPFPDADTFGFEPRFADAVAELHAARRIEGGVVQVHAFYYARQHETHEMVHSGHTVVRADDFRWPVSWSGRQQLPWGDVAASRLRGPDGEQYLVWHWYAVRNAWTASEYRAKAATAWSLATGHGDHSLAFVLVTPLTSRASTTSTEAMQAATRRLETATRVLQPSIDGIVDAER